MTVKKEENLVWDFGFYNALRFIQTAWRYSRNLEVLLNETCFQGKLNIHISIDGDKIFKTKLKKQNFQNLKLSKWEKRETVFSALIYIFETDSKNNKFLSTIRFYIRDQISYICNELYFKDIIQLYKKYNFFQLYSEKCILGCKDVFISSDYSDQHSFYLNHIGLENYLVELNIDIKIFSQIKILCNKNQNYTFFVLFLEKYTFNNYKIFSKQTKYDYLITITQFFTLKNSNNFIDCKFFDYDTFSLEFNKIEQQRVVTLVKIHLQKRNKVITQKSKQILIYVYNSKPIKYTSMFILIAFIIGRYLATSAFAIDTNPNPSSGLLGGPPGTAVSPSNPAPTPVAAQKSRKPRTTVFAPYYTETLSANNSADPSVIKIEGGKSFLEIEKEKSEKSKLAQFKKLMKSTRKAKPSDASSDVVSNVPLTPDCSLYSTKCKIVDGRLYNETTTKEITAKSDFDQMIDLNSFQKLPEKCTFWNRTIFRAKLKSDSIKPYTQQPYYVMYYPNGPKTYAVSLCGNIGQASELKDIASKVQDAVSKSKNYTYGKMTVEHGVLHFHSRAYGIGMTDRSNTQDSSYGVMIPDSLNKRMGNNPPQLDDVYTRRRINMFTETDEVNFSGVILKDYHDEWLLVGDNLVQDKCYTVLKTELDTTSRKIRRTMKPKNYDKLSAEAKKKKEKESALTV